MYGNIALQFTKYMYGNIALHFAFCQKLISVHIGIIVHPGISPEN